MIKFKYIKKGNSMKKKTIIILLIILVLAICLIIGINLYNKREIKKTESTTKFVDNIEERRASIEESVVNAVEKNIKAQYPSCPISKEYKGENYPQDKYDSSFLINNGYIKKSELLDIDDNSYCEINASVIPYYENPQDYQNNCEVYYKIKLKCLDYEVELESINKTDILYTTTYYFGLGSRSVKVYIDGKVYDDLELENPNHNENYKYLKTLSEEELNNLSDKIKNTDNVESLKEYVIELIYGVKEFDNSGNY